MNPDGPDTIANDAPHARSLRMLKQWIHEGSLGAGESLPSERILAQKLGVSRNTVRRALRHLMAEGLLRRQRSRSRAIATPNRGTWVGQAIITVVPALAANDPFSPYWAEFSAMGTVRAVQAAGKHAITLNPESITPAQVAQLVNERPLGAVVPEVSTTVAVAIQLADTLAGAGVPVVVYGGFAEMARFDHVQSDHAMGSYELTRWLISQGRKRILNAWPKPHDRYWFINRRSGYERAMAEANLPPLPTGSIPDISASSIALRNAGDIARYVAGHLVEALSGANAVDAIMAGTDREVFWLAEAVRLFGKVPGQDILITGYDNYFKSAEFAASDRNVLAATVDKRNDLVGEALVKLLLDRVENRLPASPQTRTVRPDLVVNAE